MKAKRYYCKRCNREIATYDAIAQIVGEHELRCGSCRAASGEKNTLRTDPLKIPEPTLERLTELKREDEEKRAKRIVQITQEQSYG
jgi:DNA-directed RNA polymerase subunit RPC12/RpoP